VWLVQIATSLPARCLCSEHRLCSRCCGRSDGCAVRRSVLGPAVELRGGARQHCAGAAVLACVLDCTMVVHAIYGPCGRHRCCRPPAINACLCVGLCSQLQQQTWRNKLSLVTPTELSCSSLHAEAPLRKWWQCPTYCRHKSVDHAAHCRAIHDCISTWQPSKGP
jgi:hypothetical protein